MLFSLGVVVVHAQLDQDIYCHSGQYCSFENPDTSEALFRQNPSDGYLWFIPFSSSFYTPYTPPTTPSTTPPVTTTPTTTPPTTNPETTTIQPPPTNPQTQNPSPNTQQNPTQQQNQTPTELANQLYNTVLFYLPGQLGTSTSLTSLSIALHLSELFPGLVPAQVGINQNTPLENSLALGTTPLPGDPAYVGSYAEPEYEYYTEDEEVEVVVAAKPGISAAATTTQKRKVLKRRPIVAQKQKGIFDDPLILLSLGVTGVALLSALGFAAYKQRYGLEEVEETNTKDGASRDTFA